MEIDINKIRILAESAERRAKELHAKHSTVLKEIQSGLNPHLWAEAQSVAHGYLNDFFYWSGKATSYRGIVAMAEMQAIVEEELEEEGSCP